MLSETQLKERLEVIANNNFKLPKVDLDKLVPDMLAHIGSIDGYLRDELIYTTFGTWIIHQNAMDQKQLQSMLPKILGDQHMFYQIGEQNTDSVFTRSFSVLLLPLILINHRSKPFLTAEEVHQIKEKLFDYLKCEKDIRGYVDGKGWAHAIAHAADALDDVVQCVELQEKDLSEALDVARSVICLEKGSYTHMEDERMTTAVIALIKRQLVSDAEIMQWILGFADLVLMVTSIPEKMMLRSNVKNFLQSLYFRLKWEVIPNNFNAAIDQTLKKINPFIKQA